MEINSTQTLVNSSKLETAIAKRNEAQDVASMFEQIFVKKMVENFRKSNVPGQEGGMFGDGPGADTYAQWFDDHMATHLSDNGDIGISSMLMKQFTKLGEIQSQSTGKEINYEA